MNIIGFHPLLKSEFSPFNLTVKTKGEIEQKHEIPEITYYKTEQETRLNKRTTRVTYTFDEMMPLMIFN